MTSSEFDRAYAEARPGLLDAARALTGRRDDIEDVLARVASLGHAARHQLSPGPQTSAWLRSALSDSLRRRFRQRPHTPLPDRSARGDARAGRSDAAGGGVRVPHALRVAARGEEVAPRGLEPALAALSEDLRRPLRLFYEGWNIDLIAERLAITPLCVRERLATARRVMHDRVHAQ